MVILLPFPAYKTEYMAEPFDTVLMAGCTGGVGIWGRVLGIEGAVVTVEGQTLTLSTTLLVSRMVDGAGMEMALDSSFRQCTSYTHGAGMESQGNRVPSGDCRRRSMIEIDVDRE
uniref:Uncharacterized protein n=1 Tax=Phlebotomus papatasi TaxID=29031 RepID=A0A1B0DNJ7_PHLPP